MTRGAPDDPVVAVLGARDDRDVIAYVAAAQADPARHVTYLGTDPATVRAELAAVEDWRERTWVACDGERVVGVLTADLDAALGRLWWLGPWADDRPTGLRLLRRAAAEVARGVAEREFAPDERNGWLADLAVELGYNAEVPSAVMVVELVREDADGSTSTWVDDHDLPPAVADVRALEPEDRDDVARLHDHLFAGTHTRGRDLVRDQQTTVLVVGEPPTGYVATQVQADGSVYVDFVGVDPRARGRGLARALVAAALEHALAAGVAQASLTVRDDNRHARALYASLGFTDERRIAPHRLGFTRDDQP